MFRNRRNSQKPADELYASFRQSFPHIGPATATSSAASTQSTTSISDALTDSAMNQRHFHDHDDVKDSNLTPQASNDHWRFTPSLLDTNSFAFTSFANHAPGYYTPTPGGTNTLYQSQAGDLHTPGMGFHLGTPLSMPTSEGHLHGVSTLDLHGFHPHLIHSQPYQQADLFAPEQSYAPSSFVHQDSGYEAMESERSPQNGPSMEVDTEQSAHKTNYLPRRSEGIMAAPPLPSIDKFRFQVTLSAPTAMIRHSDEIPVTYLNKGQAYSMTILDSLPLTPSPSPVKYRTVVRISFEDEHQRKRPSACWQLWKEGRGLAEAHQRNGKLQAVEYVDPNQGGDEETKRPRVELESASFDCFSVTWSPNTGSTVADCSVAVRFNFLSTDFSHSKGVKGIPVRLCAKTEVISSGTPDSLSVTSSEVCFCKVKLFRDHGAERKLSNDVTHIKKTIDKLKQQITQVESGVKEFGKRKRRTSIATRDGSSRPGKIQKHKRTWSVSSQSSAGRPVEEDDLHLKLATMQDMFSSNRPVSVLYLKGYDQDDPDLFPVALPGEPQDLVKVEALSRKASWDQRPSVETSPTNSCVLSPSPSSQSMPSQSRSSERSGFQKPIPFDPTQQVPNDWTKFTHLSTTEYQPCNTQTRPPFSIETVKVPRGHSDGTLPDWIEALGVDPSYDPPSQKSVKPVACFYVLVKMSGKTPGGDYYRAVYLMQRTVKDLITNIAVKCQIDPLRVIRTFRINSKGLKIMVDDEVVRELPEGQDMAVEFIAVDSEIPSKSQQGIATTDVQATVLPSRSGNPGMLEMRLLY